MKHINSYNEELSPELLKRASDGLRDIKHGRRALNLEIGAAKSFARRYREQFKSYGKLHLWNKNLEGIDEWIHNVNKSVIDKINKNTIKDRTANGQMSESDAKAQIGKELENLPYKDLNASENGYEFALIFNGKNIPAQHDTNEIKFIFKIYIIPSDDVIDACFEPKGYYDATDKLLKDYCKTGTIMIGAISVNFEGQLDGFNFEGITIHNSKKLGDIKLNRKGAHRVLSTLKKVFSNTDKLPQPNSKHTLGQDVQRFIMDEDLLGNFGKDTKDFANYISKVKTNDLYTDENK